MLGKIRRNTIKWQVLITLPLLILNLIFKVIDYRYFLKIEQDCYVHYENLIEYLGRFLTGASSATSIIFLIYTTYKYLLSNETIRMFSLPYKKSSILLSVTLPTIAVSSISYSLGLVLENNFIFYLEYFFRPDNSFYNYHSDKLGIPYIAGVTLETFEMFIIWALIAADILLIILLIFAICKSLNPSDFLKNFIAFSIIGALIVGNIIAFLSHWGYSLGQEIYTIIENVTIVVIVGFAIAAPIVIKNIADKKMSIT